MLLNSLKLTSLSEGNAVQFCLIMM